MATEYGRYTVGVETNHSDSNSDPTGTSGEASIFVSGSGTAAKFYQVNGNGDKGTVLTTDIVSGDATMSAAGALTIAAGAVENSMLADDAVDSDELAAGAIDTAHIADDQVTLAKMAGLARGKFIYGDASGDPAALAAGANGKILVADANGDPSWTTLSGDATLSAGAITIAAGAVEGSMLADDCISAQSNLGGTGVADGDEFVFSDAGTLKALTGANLYGWVFSKVSGDATVAAGGALTIAADAVENSMIADNAVDDTHIRLRNNQYLNGRNAADDGDVNIIKVINNNGLQIGDGAATSFMISASSPFVSASNPSFSLSSSIGSNANGGRYSTFQFKGTRADGASATLAQIRGFHHGTGADDKGALRFYVNDGDDTTTLNTTLDLGSDLSATFYGDVKMGGTTPKLTIGDAGAEDTLLVFDGNAQDYRIGLDDGTDVLEFGVGSAHGTTTSLKMDASLNVDVAGHNGTVGLKLGGTLVTATAAELNYVDVTAGTGTASKALVLDGSRDVDTINALGIASMASNWTNAGRTVADAGILTTVDINGGSVDGAVIGAASAAAGTFAALKWSSLSGSGNAEVVGTIASTGAIASSGSITAGSSFIIGSADMNEADLEKLDGITNGTAAASKAVVLDGSKNIATIGTIGCGAITSTGASTMGSLNVGGTLACDTSFTIDAVALNATELGYLDGTTAGTSAASKAMVTDASGDILMPDSDKLELGASSDMQLYHDGTNSYIANKTGALKVATETSGIAVTIGHSTSEVTVADNLTVSGNLTVTGTTVTDSVEVISTSSGVLFEGGTDDGHEGTLISAVAGADVTYTLPNLTGHIPLLAGAASNASVTAAEFALLDGGSSVATVTVADGDGVMFNDAGTMKQITVQSLSAYFDDEITAMPNLVTTAATTVGTIASGVWAAGAVTSSGRIVSDDATEATSTTDGSLQTDGGLSVAKSAVIGRDLDLLSDGSILNFGVNQDVSLTHVHDDGLLLNSSRELQFGDSATNIAQSSDGILKLSADSSLWMSTPDVLISSATSDKPQLELRNTNADANPGTLLFNHDSASPADDDELGEIVFNGDNDAAESVMFAKISASSSDVTDATEDGMLEFKFRANGAIKEITMGDGGGLVLENDSTYGTVKAHSFVTYSDETLKTNFKAIDNPLEMVKKLNGLNYTWKSDGSKDIGFIAQEVEKVVPEVVYSKNGEAGSYGMDYSSLTALLAEAIKQQDSEITSLKATLAKVLAKLDK
jgi:hypothetical protein